MPSLASFAINLAKLGIKKTTGAAAGISSALAQALGATALAGNSGLAADAAHVHPRPTPAQLNAFGLPCPWNPVSNVATLPDTTTISLLTNTAPTGDNAFFATVGGTLLVPLTQASGGFITTVNLNDIVYYVGAAGWGKLLASVNGTTGSLPLKGDGLGGLTNAILNVDYGVPTTLSSGVSIGLPPMGSIGPNGFLTIPSAWVFPNAGTFNPQTAYYSSPGTYFYFPAGAVSPTSLPGFYFTMMAYSGVMYGTLTTPGTGYVNGTYTNVALTNLTGTGALALANITVAGGVVTQVVITHQGTGYAVGNTLSVAAATVGGTGSGFVYTVSILNAYNTTSGITSLTLTTPGTGYVNGTYTNVALVSSQGVGVAAQATITVQGGVVVAAAVTIQGSGYVTTAGSNQLTANAASLGGAGSGLVLTVAAVGQGPMTGIVYNNMYTPGVNGGAWSTSNLCWNVPASPTPFSGTQGSFYSAAATGTNAIVLAAIKAPAGSIGANGRVENTVFMSAMNSTLSKYVGTGLGTSATVLSYKMGQGASASSGLRGVQTTRFYNRGSQGYQYAPSTDSSASIANYGSVNTAVDTYLTAAAWINSATSGLWATPGVLTGGSGYTNGTYTNVALTGGTGTGATANITVAAGTVTSVVLTNAGTGYVTGNSLSASTATIGTGTLFTYVLNGGAITAAGTGYTNGTYYNVPLTGGAGSGAVANITVAAGAVANIVIVVPGTGYVATNTLSASTTFLGAGTGFVYTVGTTVCAPDWTVMEYVTFTVYPQA